MKHGRTGGDGTDSCIRLDRVIEAESGGTGRPVPLCMKERMMSESNCSTQTYVFGRSVGEAQSIQQLAQILAPVTRQFLEQAGLCAGMKVLEVGSGAGDVALLAAELVGPTGTV